VRISPVVSIREDTLICFIRNPLYTVFKQRPGFWSLPAAECSVVLERGVVPTSKQVRPSAPPLVLLSVWELFVAGRRVVLLPLALL
jgi:hypothetical protein